MSTALEKQKWWEENSNEHMAIIMTTMFGGGGVAFILNLIGWKESYYLIGLIFAALAIDIIILLVIDILASKELKARAARDAPTASSSTAALKAA